jgi:ATP-binding cassette subfamily B protein
VAVIGPTGCGKTTLINLLMRFYDATEGEVFLDGVNVREYPLKELRQRISLTQQKAVLFSGTLASNVVYGCEDRRDDIDYIRAAGYASGSDEFVSQIPEGYEAAVSRGGSNFSGGQRQRISIARTVAKPAEILIFDDSFSALDFKTDRTVRERLNEKYPDQTKIIVAQRIGTILDADQILVMENGQIVGKGTHRELLSACQTYREIAESQLSQEELS